MSVSKRRVLAIFRKELREYRRNGNVGERQQGTLEPVLATPVRREEFLLGKALAAFVPSLAISYASLPFSSPAWSSSRIRA